MNLFLTTPTKIEPFSWSIMGVNVKENDNPIGHFGTGLKMAIAVLLRTNHNITIKTKDQEYVFGIDLKTLRGKDFWVCTCNGEELPYTTELGKEWDVWMAYRELISNTIDEGGAYSDEPLSDETTIYVNGAEISQCHKDHDLYFCHNRKILDEVSIHNGSVQFLEGKGVVYYKGVKVGSVENAAHDYNILAPIKLTEDRTIKNEWEINTAVADAIVKSNNSKVIKDHITNTEGWEANVSLDYRDWGSNFISVCRSVWQSTPQKLIKAVRSKLKTKVPDAKFETFEPNQREVQMLDECSKLLELEGIMVPENIKYVDNPDDNIIAYVSQNQIYLTKQAFKRGKFELCSTLYEECMHLKGYSDESRCFERYLMDTIIQMIQEKHEKYL